MDEKRRRAEEVIQAMLSPEHIAAMEDPSPRSFASEFPRLAYEHAFVDLWTRPGLSLKGRSLMTIGILVGSRNERELNTHFGSGLRNGLTPEQLKEIIYHATAYAGFPVASTARLIAAVFVSKTATESSI